MTIRTTLPLLALAALTTAASASAIRDGGIIRNSGSTNTAAYEIKLWSDGSAMLIEQGRQQRYFRVTPETSERFFRDVAAARAEPGVPRACMKSASFGTRTTVLWHGYLSVDLQCPPLSPAVARLAADVSAVQASASIDTRIRRIPLPHDLRKIPTATPEVQPT